MVARRPCRFPPRSRPTAARQRDVSVHVQLDRCANSPPPGREIAVSANQLPLAGGLSSLPGANFQPGLCRHGHGGRCARFWRPAGRSLSLRSKRLGPGSQPHQLLGVPAGTTLLSDGTGYVDIPPGSSLTLSDPNVLVPAGLTGTTNTAFVAVITTIYNQIGTAAQTSPVRWRQHGFQSGAGALLWDRPNRQGRLMSTMIRHHQRPGSQHQQ